MARAESYLSYLQSEQAQAIFRLSQAVTDLMRDFLGGRGFMEFLPPVVSSVTDPGLRGAERIPVSLYDQKAYVTSSMVFHKQVLATAFKRVYAFSPNVRLEPVGNAESGRHLVEFCQMDLEEADVPMEESMSLVEGMLRHVVSGVTLRWEPLLRALGRDLLVPELPFKRFRYDDLLDLAVSMGLAVKYGEELPQAVESRVSAEVGGFFWITDYPKPCRGFYYREAADGRTVRSMDLLYPEGFGEAISGGEREYRPDAIRRRMAQSGLDPADFADFLSEAETGLRPTSGFGIGVERLVRYVCGERDITSVRPFPKTPGSIAM